MTRTVLLVDDSETIRITLLALLEDAGHRVIEAASLAAGRAQLANTAPGTLDVAIIDWYLSDGHGDELVRELHDRHPSTTVIILSGADVADIEGVDLIADKDAGGDIAELLEKAIAVHASRR